MEATSIQFNETTAEALNQRAIPTGNITVQREDTLNNIEPRCYVPTTWGTSILKYGDWVVIYAPGIVVTLTNAQHALLFEENRDNQLDFPVEATTVAADQTVIPALMLRMDDPRSEELFREFLNQYRLDYVLLSDSASGDMSIVRGATGATVASGITFTSILSFFADGRVEVE